MVLESCMILLDNSEFMRNSDYVPTRLEAQHDAANFLVGTKTRSNPESTVGVIAMCGHTQSGSGELLVSPTDDVGKILNALHGVPMRNGVLEANTGSNIGGGVDIVVSLQVANLALKHRRNKNGVQRVVAFVGSPLSHVDNRAMAKAGRMLKKNNLSIDVVAMGELEENEAKLKELVDAANGTNSDTAERTCHLVTIPAGVLPSDVLVTSPIVHGGAGVAGAGGTTDGTANGASGAATGAAGAFSDFGGVDPNMDPELAMALRVSMEEERARQERVTAAAANNSNNADASASERTTNNNTTTTSTALEGADSSENNNDNTAQPMDTEPSFAEEDALLQQALAMSMENEPAVNADDNAVEVQIASKTNAKPDVEMKEEDEEDEDAEMQLALQMSMQPDAEETANATTTTAAATTAPEESSSAATTSEGTNAQGTQQFQDPQYVNQLLGSLPGVDTNDPELNSTIRNLLDNKERSEEKDDKDKK